MPTIGLVRRGNHAQRGLPASEASKGAAGIDAADPRTNQIDKAARHRLVETLKGLAIPIDGTLGFHVARRVITNGSIYMDLVQFTDGQKFLLALPDEALPEGSGLNTDGMAVCAPSNPTAAALARVSAAVARSHHRRVNGLMRAGKLIYS